MLQFLYNFPLFIHFLLQTFELAFLIEQLLFLTPLLLYDLLVFISFLSKFKLQLPLFLYALFLFSVFNGWSFGLT
jgi:hypothetical protein